MKIAIDARGINLYNGTGIGTYTENILKNLITIDSSNNYHIFWSGNNFESIKKENCKIIMTSKKHQRFFEDYYFPENISKENIDIYHMPQNGIGFSQAISCKKVVTIHDLIPYVMPETVGRGYLLKFLKEMPIIVGNSDGIITVSEFSKRDILKYFPIDESKIFVTPLAADAKYAPLDRLHCKNFLKKAYNLNNPFLLYLGGFSERKNVASAITAFSKVYKDLSENYDLVIVGDYRDSGQKLMKLTNELNMLSHVIFAGFVPEEHLPLFYNSCDALIYPSFYEGFGLPPLEAMNCGTPVIASNLTSIPEVVGDTGILINPYDIESIAFAIGNLLSSENLRSELSAKALLRAKQFSWQNTASLTLKVYESVYNSEFTS
ncbi:glycosyltransferase family 4 protein [Clostridium estertheticum]|uniref:Glycosyl transferase n=1 Tax=Clostridium estertheticum subsp. estertheticum TaxID=1552 RepID=A0A1J0GBN6_9CLOT|nr:glycosyltransferase family 1 protein [Clostridium estertheticum]APC38746.1 glycosyl transferase [Clostridium estertheticum subsp. estertheticum]MBZ9615398.1 glycosyltransferase family 4 protein [Clostridium estertheticum subsp. laramiense]WAG75284.1 glycosyltransferase family 4 protein [Clostridium estertheticum]